MSAERLWALAHYIAPRVPSSTHLRICVARADFEAFRDLGHPITGTTWRKGREFAYPDGMTEAEWERAGQRIFRQHRPLALVVAGDVIAVWAAFKAATPRRARLRP